MKTAVETSSVYGLMAEFEGPEALIHAAEKVRHAGYQKFDAYSPFPIEELSHAMDLAPTRLPRFVLTGGLLGCMTGLGLQYWVSVIAYPLNIGGRPLFSWPAFLPIIFECTVLFSAFAAVFGMLGRNGFPMPYHPVFNVQAFERATRDRFFICLESKDPQFNLETTRAFLEALKPLGVFEVAP